MNQFLPPPPFPTVNPCLTDFSEVPKYPCNVPWEGPYFITLCSNDLDWVELNCSNPPPPPCCFYIQYYDRLVDCENNYFYDIQVVYVGSSDGCRDCFELEQDKILAELLYRKFDEHSTDYFRDIWDDGNPNGNIYCTSQHHRVTLGACYRLEGNPAEWVACSDLHCCANWLKICYYDDGTIVPGSLENFGGSALYPEGLNEPYQCSGAPINCEDGTIKCDLELNGKCGIPCNMGEWSEQQYSDPISVAGCLGCTFRIKYGTRVSTDCTPEFYDYQIDEIYQITMQCSQCPQLAIAIRSAANDWMLKNGGLPLPDEEDEIFSNYRIISALCWYIDYNNPVWMPCQDEVCCYSMYSIEYLAQNTYDIEYIGGSEYFEPCPDFDNCIAFCTTFPVKTDKYDETPAIINKAESEVNLDYVTYSGNDEISIKYISQFIGEIEITVSDVFGNVVYKNKKDKNLNGSTFVINTADFRSGIYYYKISGKSTDNSYGKFIIRN